MSGDFILCGLVRRPPATRSAASAVSGDRHDLDQSLFQADCVLSALVPYRGGEPKLRHIWVTETMQRPETIVLGFIRYNDYPCNVSKSVDERRETVTLRSVKCVAKSSTGSTSSALETFETGSNSVRPHRSSSSPENPV